VGRTGTTRRRALAGASAAAAALLAGCTSSPTAKTSPGAGKEAAAAALRVLQARSAATSRALLDRYDAVLARHPAEAARLGPLRAAVARHVSALTPKPAPGSPAAPGPTAASAAPGTRAVTVPADPVEAVRTLVTAERHAGDAQTAAVMGAPPELARLLASVAAASAVHTYLLSQGASA
jgi:hypothetical protein